MPFVQPKGFWTMEWVGGTTTMMLGVVRSVRIIVTTYNTVLATLQVCNQQQVGDAARILPVQPKGIQTIEWVGGATTMTLGMFRSVGIIVATCNTVLATLQVCKQQQVGDAARILLVQPKRYPNNWMSRGCHHHYPGHVQKCQNNCNNM